MRSSAWYRPRARFPEVSGTLPPPWGVLCWNHVGGAYEAPTERHGNHEYRATRQPRSPTDRAFTATDRPSNREHRATKQRRTPTEKAKVKQRRKQWKQRKLQQNTKTISSSKDRASISNHISSYGPKPGRVLGHKSLALQADQYKK